MIKHNLKKCTIKNCENYLFAKGLCKFHYRIAHSKSIEKRSNKRIIQEIEYKESQSNRKLELILLKKWVCIFCGQDFNTCIWHHSRGRDGDLLCEGKYLYPSHSLCHSNYHDLSIERLSWWNDYMERIKEWDPELYQKELIKVNKSK